MKTTIEKRLTALEREMTELRGKMAQPSVPEKPWWEQIAGTFANDPLYDEAMRLGREYRESTRPGKPTRKRLNVRTRH